MNIFLGTSYLPGREYFRKISEAETVIICGGNPWQKQTLRNRTFILSPNGVQRLIIPVIHTGEIKSTDAEIRIDYSLPWIREHKGALEAAYNTSPCFEFLKDDLFVIYDSKPLLLFDLNFRILQLMLKKLKCSTILISAPETVAELTDLEIINSKELSEDAHLPQYPQVFSYKFGFTARLSMLDEISNKMQ